MKKRGVTLIAGVALICLLLGAYFGLRSYNEKQEEEEAEAAAGEEILTIDPDAVTEVSFDIGGEEVSFALDDEDTWFKTDDEKFPVKTAALLTPLNQLVPLQAVRVLTDPEDLSEYGLDEPQQVFAITEEDGSTTVLSIGDTNEVTGDDYLMLNGDDSVIYTVSTGLRESFSDDLYDYAVSEDLPNIQASDITGIAVSESDGAGYDLRLTNAVWTVDGEEADSDLANDLTSAAAELAYAGYYEYDCADPEAYNLADPAAELTITWQEPVVTEEESEEESEDGTGEEETETETETQYLVYDVTFAIGGTDDEGNYYVQMEDSTEVHAFPADTLDTILDCSGEDLISDK